MYILGISKPWTCLFFRSILPLMSDTARDYQTVEPASIEGFSDIFDVGLDQAQHVDHVDLGLVQEQDQVFMTVI